jgi:large subunit ribosomal protein L24
MKIKTNDNVKVLSGKDAGKTGKVIQVFPKLEKAVVEGVNLMKKHLRVRKEGEKGQVLELAAPMHVSKLSLVCPHCGKSVRVGYKMDGETKKTILPKVQSVYWLVFESNSIMSNV